MSDPPAITPDSLLPCGGDKFLCTDNMELQTVLNVLYEPSPSATHFRISSPDYAPWIMALATRNVCAHVVVTLPDGAYLLLNTDVLLLIARTAYDDDEIAVTDAFKQAAARGIRLVTRLHVEGAYKHAVAVAFDFKTCTLHVVDSNGFMRKKSYAEALETALVAFLFDIFDSNDMPFRVIFPSQLEFACAPQRGLYNDNIVKSGSCAGWAYLFLYALCHWSACDLTNPYWYRCLATKLTGIAQPTNVQYYAVLLRFLTQLISTAKLEITPIGVVDLTTNMHVDPPANFMNKNSIAYVLRHEHGSVSAHDFLQWFRALEPVRPVLTAVRMNVRVHIPEAWRRDLQTIQCPLYMYTRHGRYVMTRVNTWNYIGSTHTSAFAQLRSIINDSRAEYILTDVYGRPFASCFISDDDTLHPSVYTSNTTHAAALLAVALAFVIWYEEPDQVKISSKNLSIDGVLDIAMPCLRVGALGHYRRIEGSADVWKYVHRSPLPDTKRARLHE